MTVSDADSLPSTPPTLSNSRPPATGSHESTIAQAPSSKTQAKHRTDELHLHGVRLVEGRVVEGEHAFFAAPKALHFLPQGRRLERLSRQKARESAAGRSFGRERLVARGLGATEDALGGQKKRDVVGVGAARSVYDKREATVAGWGRAQRSQLKAVPTAQVL